MADLNGMSVSETAGEMLTGEHADVVREAVRLVIAELMEAEVAELTVPVSTSARQSAPTTATATAGAAGTRAWAASSWRSRACDPAVTSRASLSPAAAQSRPWSRWSPRPT